MTWIFFATAAHIMWGIANLIDKYVIDKKLKNPYLYIIYLDLVNIWIIFLIPFVDFYFPGITIITLIFLGSLSYTTASFLYAKAVSLEEISRINILWQLIPVMTFFIAWFVFGEALNKFEFIAFIILISAGIIASFHIDKNKFSFSKATFWMTAACFFYSIYAIIFDRLLNSVSVYLIFIYFALFNFIIAGSFLLFLKKERKEQKKNLNGKLLVIIILCGVIDYLAILSNIKALSLGRIALVFSFEAVQIIFVFVISVGLTVFLPKIIKEKIDRKNILLKIVALFLVVIGIFVLSLN